MNTTIYKLTSPKIKGGAIYLSYYLGQLRAFDRADAQPTDEQLAALLARLPAREAALPAVSWGTMKLEPLPERSAKDKIVLFCAAYREYRGLAYTSTQTERSNLRTVPVSQALLDVFFGSPLLDFSIRNYIQRINQTRDVLKNGRDLAARLPDAWDPAYAAKLDGPKLVGYRQHLLKLGWRYDGSRQTWVAPA